MSAERYNLLLYIMHNGRIITSVYQYTIAEITINATMSYVRITALKNKKIICQIHVYYTCESQELVARTDPVWTYFGINYP